MTLKSDKKFEEKLTSGLENYMRNFVSFHRNFDGMLLSKAENV